MLELIESLLTNDHKPFQKASHTTVISTYSLTLSMCIAVPAKHEVTAYVLVNSTRGSFECQIRALSYRSMPCHNGLKGSSIERTRRPNQNLNSSRRKWVVGLKGSASLAR